MTNVYRLTRWLALLTLSALLLFGINLAHTALSRAALTAPTAL